MHDGQGMGARAFEQGAGVVQQALARPAVGVQSHADLAIRMQHIVLIVQRQHRDVGLFHTKTSKTSCTSSQLTRSTRFMRMRQPSPSAASLWV
ncbi:hypothetical protein D3C71_1645880 [compost metagenome]